MSMPFSCSMLIGAESSARLARLAQTGEHFVHTVQYCTCHQKPVIETVRVVTANHVGVLLADTRLETLHHICFRRKPHILTIVS